MSTRPGGPASPGRKRTVEISMKLFSFWRGKRHHGLTARYGGRDLMKGAQREAAIVRCA